MINLTEYSLAIKNPWRYALRPVIKYKWYHHVVYPIQAGLMIAAFVLIASIPMLGYVLALRMIYD